VACSHLVVVFGHVHAHKRHFAAVASGGGFKTSKNVGVLSKRQLAGEGAST